MNLVIYFPVLVEISSFIGISCSGTASGHSLKGTAPQFFGTDNTGNLKNLFVVLLPHFIIDIKVFVQIVFPRKIAIVVTEFGNLSFEERVTDIDPVPFWPHGLQDHAEGRFSDISCAIGSHDEHLVDFIRRVFESQQGTEQLGVFLRKRKPRIVMPVDHCPVARYWFVYFVDDDTGSSSLDIAGRIENAHRRLDRVEDDRTAVGHLIALHKIPERKVPDLDNQVCTTVAQAEGGGVQID